MMKRELNLKEANFLYVDLVCENLTQGNLLTDYENELKVFGLRGLSWVFLSGINILEKASRFLSQGLSLDRKTFILRCCEYSDLDRRYLNKMF